MARVIVGTRGAGKTMAFVEVLLTDHSAWLVVSHTHRLTDVRGLIRDHAMRLGRQSMIASASERVITYHDAVERQMLRGRRVETLMVDDVDGLLGGLLGHPVDAISVTAETREIAVVVHSA